MVAAAERHGRILQVGHLERFNPAVAELERRSTLPLFFEIHRLNVFSPRSLDVDVVLDLMIHDVDIVLALAKAEPAEIRAAGIRILSQKVDIANVRLQFPNGCVANLTASRVSTERVRKLRLFQPKQYLSLDYGRQDLLVFPWARTSKSASKRPPWPAEPLKLQFDAFLDCVEARKFPKCSGAAARQTLGTALAILDKIEGHCGNSLAIVGRQMETEVTPPPEAELHLLTDWDEPGRNARIGRSAGLSLLSHAAAIVFVLVMPETLMQPPRPKARMNRLSRPLVLPSADHDPEGAEPHQERSAGCALRI